LYLNRFLIVSLTITLDRSISYYILSNFPVFESRQTYAVVLCDLKEFGREDMHNDRECQDVVQWCAQV
jgi:hypothetical protein